MRRIGPVVGALLALLAPAAAPASGQTVTTRIRPGAGLEVRKLSDASGVLLLELGRAGVPGRKVHSARLVLRRDAITGADEGALVDVQVFPLRSAWRQGRPPETDAEPLPPAGPGDQWLDATQWVRDCLSGKRPAHGIHVKALPGWRPEQTHLDVMHEGTLAKPPPAVKGLRAFHRSGQTFVTWKEIEPRFEARTVPWGKLREAIEKVDAKRQVRYRVYRHARPLTPRNLHEAELLAEVAPLSAFNVNARCVEYGIDRQLATADIAIPRQFDVFEGASRDAGLGLEYPVGRFAIEEASGPLPPGTGLYVHTAAQRGSSHYAVTVAVDGAESSTAVAAAGPVDESPAEPEPVLQGELAPSPYWAYPAKRWHYVQWCGPPKLSNLPNAAYSYGVSVPHKPPRDGRMPLEIHFHPRGFSYYRPVTRLRTDSLAVCPYDFPNPSGFYGYHESLGTLKSFRQGAVRNYTERRILSFLKWVRAKWKIDEARITCVAGVPGGVSAEMSAGSEALWFALAHRDFVNAVACGQPVIDTSTMSKMGGPRWRRRPSVAYRQREAAWGRREWGLKTGGGGPAWSAQDCTPILAGLKPLERLPFVAIGGDTPEIRAFVTALRDARRGLWQLSSWGSSPLLVIDGTSVSTDFHCGLRLDRSYPAITHCSTDSVKHPTIEHGSRARWDGETLVDLPDKYEVTIHAASYYPTKRMTAKVTLRRLQEFVVRPGASYRWQIADPNQLPKALQSGKAVAGDDGLLSIEGCELTNAPRRLMVEPDRGD